MGNGAEVLHVRAKDNGMTAHGGFDDILSPLPHQALADEDDGGNLIEPLQFPRGIDDEAIAGSGPRLESRADVGTEDEFDLLAFRQIHYFTRALDVTRDENQEEARKLPAEVGHHVEEDFLFAGMGAAGDKNRLRRRDANKFKQLDRVYQLRFGVRHRHVVFHVAAHMDTVAGDADGDEIVGVPRDRVHMTGNMKYD